MSWKLTKLISTTQPCMSAIHLCGYDSGLYHVPELADRGVHIFWVDDFFLFREHD